MKKIIKTNKLCCRTVCGMNGILKNQDGDHDQMIKTQPYLHILCNICKKGWDFVTANILTFSLAPSLPLC